MGSNLTLMSDEPRCQNRNCTHFFTPASKHDTLAVSLTRAVQATLCIHKRLSPAPKRESYNGEFPHNSFTGFFETPFSPDLAWQPGICLDYGCKHACWGHTFSISLFAPVQAACPSPAPSLLSPLTRVTAWFLWQHWSHLFSHDLSPLTHPQQCWAGLACFTLPLTLLAAVLPNSILLVTQLLQNAF